MIRTRLALVALSSAAALLLVSPAVRAQDSNGAAWSGSTLTMPEASDVGFVSVKAEFTRNPPRDVNLLIKVMGAPAEECSPIGPFTGAGRAGPTPASLAAELSFECNGVYTVTATAHTTDNTFLSPDSASLSRTLAVSMPAPTVTGITATSEGRSITVLWDDMRSAAKDLSGYIVERSISNGGYVEVATAGNHQVSFVDNDLPSDGGQATYRVSSTRPSPAGTRVSAASNSTATPFTAAPAPPPTAGDGDGTTPGSTPPGDGTTPGAGTTPGDGSVPDDGATPAEPGPDTGTTGGRPAGGSVRVPRLGITGAFLPPLLRPSATVQPPTTIDDGFSDRLPYSDNESEPGEDDAVLPDDELASIFTDGAAGRGMAIPVATALVLAVWAFHLRFLARASRPHA